MSTIAQVQKVAAPLLERHPDLIMVGRAIVVLPVTHIVRAIRLNGSSGRGAFNPGWGATYLFRRRDHVGYGWICDFMSRIYGIWDVAHPDHQRVFMEMAETEALPALRAMKTFDDFLAFTSQDISFTPWNRYPLGRLIIQSALGDLDGGRRTCAGLWNPKAIPDEEHGRDEYLFIARSLCPLLAKDDHASIARLLHEWEAFSAKTFKLEKYWQPTPFPIERQMAAESVSPAPP